MACSTHCVLPLANSRVFFYWCVMINFKAILQSCSNAKSWVQLFGFWMDKSPSCHSSTSNDYTEKLGPLNHLSVTNEITNHLKNGMIELTTKSDCRIIGAKIGWIVGRESWNRNSVESASEHWTGITDFINYIIWEVKHTLIHLRRFD